MSIPKISTYLSYLLFLVSMFLPAFTFGENNIYVGYGALMIGPLGILAGCITWLANPLLFYSWELFSRKNYNKGFILSISSLVVALTLLLQETLPEGSSSPASSFTIGSGYYIWVMSILLSLNAHAYEKYIAKYKND